VGVLFLCPAAKRAADPLPQYISILNSFIVVILGRRLFRGNSPCSDSIEVSNSDGSHNKKKKT